MTAIAPDVSSSPKRDASYVSEVRFGVVMYGGVSLAIYINGVANEMYEMACATPKAAIDGPLKGTRDVYRKASLLLGSDKLRARYLAYLKDPEKAKKPDPLSDPKLTEGKSRTRFVVDVISGASAGGINGAFLAKALANGQEFSPLRKLWIEEGDIETLLNDSVSYKDIKFAKTNEPTRSLLNSNRMYVKLLEAFQNMQPTTSPNVKRESPLADEIDLYMTTTDIRGSVVPLRLFDEVVYERRFKQVYHFQYGGSNNEFTDDFAPFLAFAARCTSSFPFAFEPMTVKDAEDLCRAKLGGGGTKFDTWKKFFTGLSNDDLAGDQWRSRAFGDGGYLDNKPFSYAVEALSWRLGDLPMDRKLIYVEPSPEHPETERQISDKPDAIENAFRALNTIPRYETIREDLESVLARNRRIERVERIVRQVEADIETRTANPLEKLKLLDGKVPAWWSIDLKTMIDYYGVSFLPYQRLRIASVTDDIADRLAICWDVDRGSDKFYALKAMARVWREAHYYENDDDKDGRPASINKFLADYDVKYRLRRASFLLRKVHQLRSLAANVEAGKDRASLSDVEGRLFDRLKSSGFPLSSMDHGALVPALDCLARGFGASLQAIREVVWPAQACPAKPPPGADAKAMLDRVLSLLLGETLDPPLKDLPAVDGKGTVAIDLDALPPPNRIRTLQENVLARTQKLYSLARGAKSLTVIQTLLEKNLVDLRNEYATVTASSSVSTPRIRELLGNPTLKPTGPEFGAEIKVDPEVKFYDGALNGPTVKSLREFLAEYYLRFDEYDQMSFPLYYDTGTGEPSTVEVLRVSPEDARGLIDERQEQGKAGKKRRKLAGTVLFNFGAFFEEKWRRNDLMWGRLDGCERLLAALFPPTDDKAKDDETNMIREALLLEAQIAILREEMQPEGYAKLVDRFTEELAKRKEAPLKSAFEGLWKDLSPADDQQRSRQTAEVIKSVLGDDGMRNYVRDYYEVNRQFDRAATMKAGARALTITGEILQGSEKTYAGSRMVWVARGGRALHALLTVSTPGGLPRMVFRHWLALLYLFEILLLAGTLVFSAPTARTFGLTCLGATVILHWSSLIAGDLMYRRWGWAAALAFLLTLAILFLALLGGTAWYNSGPTWFLCTLFKLYCH